jgi:hypothetical protein
MTEGGMTVSMELVAAGLLSLVSVLLTVLSLVLIWQLKRIVTRIDALEAAHSDYRLNFSTQHRPWAEVRAEIDRAIAARIDPMQRQLDRIESLASGRPSSPGFGFTGRHHAVRPPDDGN